jgi:hypothetical protein
LPALFAASGTAVAQVQEAEFHRHAPPFALFRASGFGENLDI